MSDDRPQVLVGMPVAEMPKAAVPSVIRSCSMCGQDMWVSTGAAVLLVGGAKPLCVPCFNKETADEPEIEVEIGPHTFKEITEHLGRPFTLEDAQRLIQRHYPGQHIRVRVLGDTDSKGEGDKG